MAQHDYEMSNVNQKSPWQITINHIFRLYNDDERGLLMMGSLVMIGVYEVGTGAPRVA